MKHTWWMNLFIILTLTTMGQEKKSADEFLVVFYNVENLFDTENDPATQDDEFTTVSEKKWDSERYQKKLKDIAEVLSSIRKRNLPEVIGLCEVENRKVVNDLVSEKKLDREEYGIVHKDSPDTRGIDVALLYRKDRFKVLSQKAIPVKFPFDTITTRDILYVKGETNDPETFHFFVNHWSSRTEGEQITERRRIYTAVNLRKAVDSILNIEPEAKILVMGDFNDEPTNTSLHTILNANNKRKNTSNRDLYNLMYDKHNLENAGTYSYKGNWNMLDNLIVSQAVIRDREGFHLDYQDGKIFSDEWMMYENPKIGELTPNKTYGGDIYFGGVSDHLPVYMILRREE